jgi:hypothetical protein
VPSIYSLCMSPDIVEQLQRCQLVAGVGVVPGGPNCRVVVHIVVDS